MISVALVGQGVMDVPDGAEGLNTWVESAFRPDPTDRLAWRQRDGYRDPIDFIDEDARAELLQRLLAAAWNGELTAERIPSNGQTGGFGTLTVRFGAPDAPQLHISLDDMPFANHLAPLADAYLREISQRYVSDTEAVSEILRGLSRTVPAGFVERRRPTSDELADRPLFIDFVPELDPTGRGAAERAELRHLRDELRRSPTQQAKRIHQVDEYVAFWERALPNALTLSFGTLGYGSFAEVIAGDPDAAARAERRPCRPRATTPMRRTRPGCSMTVVRVDLRQPAVRARLREIKPPASSDPFPFSDSSALTDLPVRLLLIVPLDDIAATDAEDLALKLLGSDPSPRALVALVAGVARPAGSPRAVRHVRADAAGGAGPAPGRAVPGPAGGDALVRASAHGAHPPHRRRRPRLARGVRAGPRRAPDAGRDLRRRVGDGAARSAGHGGHARRGARGRPGAGGRRPRPAAGPRARPRRRAVHGQPAAQALGRSTSGCCRPSRRTRRPRRAWASCRRPSAGWRASRRPGR